MKLSPFALAISSAAAFSVLWLVCSAFVATSPIAANATFRGMMHADMPMMQVTPGGFLVGLAAWAIGAGAAAFVLAVVYNALSGGKPAP